MTQSESPPPSEEFQPDLIYARARRESVHFWIMSGAWGLAVLAFSAVLVIVLYRFESATQRIVGLEERARELISQVQKVEARLASMSQLQELHTYIYTFELLQQQYDFGRRLSPEEKKFVEAMVTRAEEQEDNGHKLNSNDLLVLANYRYIDGTENLLNNKGGGEKILRKAIEYYKRILKENPSDDQSRKFMGYALYYLNDWSAAIEQLAVVIDIYGKTDSSIKPLYYRGLAEMMMGENDAAVSSFDQSIELAQTESQRINAMENKGLVYIRQENWQQALDNSDAVVEMDGAEDARWNFLIREIAADKLGYRDAAKNAHNTWSERATEIDKWELRRLLPEGLHSYLEE